MDRTPRRPAAVLLSLLATVTLGGALPAGAELLPLECDDGASVILDYFDSDLELEHQSDTGECNMAPVGDWNRSGITPSSDAASASLLGLVRSPDGFTLEVSNEIALVVEDGEFAGASALVTGEARVRAPDRNDDVPTEVTFEIERAGELEEEELSLAFVGPGVDELEDLDELEDGEYVLDVELEPGEEYRLILFAGSALDDTGEGSHLVRARVDAIPAPEPAAALLLACGALVLRGAHLARHRPRRRPR